MTFDEILAQVRELLEREGRVAYRILKRRFALNDEDLEDLKADLIDAKRLAVDEDGKVLVWVGEEINGETGKWIKGEQEGETAKREKGQKDTTNLSLPLSNPQHSDVSRITHHVPRAEGERRQLTVMFCDLVGSTALSAQLDPEELREVIQTYQETCTEVVRRYGGYIALHLGDGLLVYFGYPTAHEDEARRAVCTGLEILTALAATNQDDPGDVGARRRRALTDPLQLPPLQVRIGIHTGPVVIGEIGSSEKREILALGETPNLAARIQGQVNPDEVMISASTYRLVEGSFTCENRGQPELKGVATPLTLYRVIKENDVPSRFAVVMRKGLTPLIGREHEVGLLEERWAQAKEGKGQVVLLSGEPGIGKSRLVEALKETVTQEEVRCLELSCSPYHQNSALQPILDHLQRTLQFQSTDSAEEKIHKLEVGARRAVPLQAETIPLLAALLSLPHPTGYPALSLSPQKQKEKTYEGLVAWLGAEAERQPVVYVWEDLHWADPSTAELLTLFLAQVPTTRILTVLTFRPEFTSPWGAHSYVSQLTLSRLGSKHVETMVEKVTGDKALPAEVVQQIISKTDGVPLFVEELTKSVVESVGATGRSPLQALGIPTTLQDALMARLDRLGPAKEIAQLGATLGREFSYELLHAVSLLREDALQQRLRQLVDTELVYQSGIPPQAHYLFKHALVQDTAYQSLLKSKRQQLHQQIAQVLEDHFPDTKETQAELLAHHYTEAGLMAQALPYWEKAGQKAVQRSAYVEAINHLTKGLELLKTLPEAPDRNQQELTLQITLGSALMAVKGLASPETERTYSRARELCKQAGNTPQFVSVLYGLCGSYTNRGELLTARELGEQLLSLARDLQDPSPLIAAHFALGQTLFWLGEFALAREHVEQGVVLYDPQRHRLLASFYGQDPGVTCRLTAALALWNLGYPAQARKRINEALTLAQELSHPYSQALTSLGSAMLYQFCQESQATREQVEVVLAFSSEQGFPFLSTRATVLRGWALAMRGEIEEGIAQIRYGLTALRRIGVEFAQSHFLTLLAEAYGKGSQTKEGLTVLAKALDFVSRTEERFYEAELYRLKGELTLQNGARDWGLGTDSPSSRAPHLKPQVPSGAEQEAEGYFRKAIEVARRQQAKSLELRAVMSLVRLRQQQASEHTSRTTEHVPRITDHAARTRLDEAYAMLSAIYNWFTEGFDTKDLQEAKALLEELSD
ncbi:MAG: adenylate/guanylate cyclase domain-containing protein [Candidatus Binatia bacterium]